MTTYALIIIAILNGGLPIMLDQGTHKSLIDCFDQRDLVIEAMGRPIFNYQVICVATDRREG